MRVSNDTELVASRVIDAAIAVHRELGPGFLDAAYEKALILELASRGIAVKRQYSIAVFYREQVITECRLDLLVQDVLVVEIKAIEELRLVHRRAGGFELGLLINFNVTRLLEGVRRVIDTPSIL